MNTKYYEEIYEEFKGLYSGLVNDVKNYRPVSNVGIRLTMQNGSQFDFDKMSKSIRRVIDPEDINLDNITDEMCRKSFSSNLARLMAKNGYNQQTLADYTGISKGAINSYARGTNTPSLTNARKIAYVLNCSIAELID